MSVRVTLETKRVSVLLLVVGIVLTTASAHADDVVVKPAAGSGFVVAAQGGTERLRVNEAGTVFVPGLPSASATGDYVLCFDGATGQLVQCQPSALVASAGLAAGSGSVYTGGQTLDCGTLITFANPNLGSDLTLTDSDTHVAVGAAGRYFIDYHVHVLTPNQMKTEVEINAAAAPALTVDYSDAGTNLSYNASSIVTLAAGATIGLRPTCTMGHVRLRPGAGASLTLMRVQ